MELEKYFPFFSVFVCSSEEQPKSSNLNQRDSGNSGKGKNIVNVYFTKSLIDFLSNKKMQSNDHSILYITCGVACLAINSLGWKNKMDPPE